MKRKTFFLAFMAASTLIAGCATTMSDAEISKKALMVMKSSFKEHGQAKLDRLDQDELMATCSLYETPDKVPKDVTHRLEQAQIKTIRYPVDGKLLGNWKEGEKIAQSGRGMQYNDDPTDGAGGNCYACHQLSKEEVSFGSIGPSLLGFGKTRGNSEEVRKYAFGKVYNSQAFSACSNMPRFGHNGILTEQQIKDVVALLLDPESPVNK